jgi:mono/diheme cytochrome c family protein
MDTLLARLRRRGRLPGALLWGGIAIALAGCGAGETAPDVPALERIEGAPADGPTPEKVEIPTDPALTPTALALYQGAAAVGTTGGVLVGSLTTNSLKPLLVVPTGDEPSSAGAIQRFAQRGTGGFFAVAENGLFHDGQGVLLYSPLNQAKELAGNPITWLDAFGAQSSEELWLVTSAGAFRVAAGKIGSFEVEDPAGVPQPAEAVVGVAPGQAIVVTAGRAYLVNIVEVTAELLLEEMGPFHGLARGEDGTVYIAAGGGLFERDPVTGALAVRTLAAAGAPAEPVLAVAASFGAVVAATQKSLVRIDAAGAVRLVDLPEPPPALAVDGQGDTWALESGKVVRHITGAPVSFESDVKPFLDAHCMSCHASGAGGAPVVDFLDYEVAKERASTIVKRLKGEGSVMPPVTVEVLTAADYAVVIRWVAGGLLP